MVSHAPRDSEEDDDWEPAVIPPRGTLWKDPWTPLPPGEEEPVPPPVVPDRRSWRTGQFAILAGGSTVIAVAWFGTMTAIPFVYLTGVPLVDFLVLSVVTLGWLAYVWRVIR